jgi:hypothetical protein
MYDNHLKLNADKTVFLSITKKRTSFEPLVLGQEAVISPSEDARNLGIQLDSNLTMDKHVSFIKQSCHYHLRNLYQIQHLLPEKQMKQLMYATITPRLDFCNSLLSSLSGKQLQRLQIVQNSAARLLLRKKAGRFEHITPHLRQLHWLPVRYRMMFKLLTLAHKIIYHNEAPQYCKTKVTIKTPGRNTRSAMFTEVESTFKPRLKTVGRNSIYFRITTEWNKIPGHLRIITSLSTFRKQLKIFLV